MSKKYTNEDDAPTLQLVRDLRSELAHGLNSLRGKQYDTIGKFIGSSAVHMNHAADGFIFVRESGRVDCSKLLVRPVIEIMFRLTAVKTKPSLIYRIAYTEQLDREKWVRAAATRQGTKFEPEQDSWDMFKKHCETQYPGPDVRDEKISLYNVAKSVGLEGYYDSHYRLYCKFTHAALEAVVGDLDPLSDAEDNRTVALCIFSVIEALITIGAAAPNLAALRTRIDELSKGG
jgi:hypothetical protein